MTPDDSAAAPSPPAAPAAAARGPAAGRPAGVSRWVNAHGKISLAGFTYHAGAAYAGEPVEVVAAGGLADILHAGVVVVTCAQRMREDQADRAPRAPVTRRARDATAGLTVTRLANRAGTVSFAGTGYRPAAAGPARPSTSRSWPGRCSCPGTARSSGSTRSGTTGPASSARSPTPKDAPAARTPPPALSPSYRNPFVARVPELDRRSCLEIVSCGPTMRADRGGAGGLPYRRVGMRFNEGVAGGLRTRDDHPAGAHRSCVAERTLGDPGAGTPQPRGRIAAAPRRACWSHAESCQVAPDRSCWARPLPVRKDEPRFRLKPGDSPGAPEFAADVWSGLRQHRQLRARRRRCLEETCHVRADHYRDRPGPRRLG